jgi:pimeloyl-ACP methyl ester carboxylesterase
MTASASDFAAVKDVRRRDIAPAGIHLPTLVIVGSEDHLAPPRYARYLARNISQSRLVVLEGVGHHPPLEAVDNVAEQLLFFLDELQSPHSGMEIKTSYFRELSETKVTSG